MSRIRNRHLFFSDALLLTISPFLLYALRFEGWQWTRAHAATAIIYTALAVPIRLATLRRFGMYSRLWRYASVAELQSIFFSALVASVICSIAGGWLMPLLGITPLRVPLSVLFTDALLGVLLVGAPRLVLRMGGVRAFIASLIGRPEDADDARPPRRILLVGAGYAGNMLAKELRANPETGLIPIGFLDDDREKHGKRLSNLPVFGPLSMVTQVILRERIDEVIISFARATGDVVRPVVRAALEAGVKTRTMPGLYEIVSGQVNVSQLREVQIQDLLRREPIATDIEQVRTLATGRTVLVTGAGGSIGSELARQIAALAPERLVLLGHGENPIFHVQNELSEKHPDLDIVPVIADIRDRRRMFQVMGEHRPFAVFHAAAHKHVPLMEDNVVEAITNNVMGTGNVVQAAVAADVQHFVLISTDKAVRPTSVMGTSKRVAEHIVRHAALVHGRNYVAVRFGNVLGSEGSVVPTFMKQIKAGGPVLVTHPEMRRYFMTIPEAVQLVLQAGALGRGGELFMLDMGEPVKIVDLASDLIRLSGLEVGVDIEIRFSGMRPGEKLYEEMFWGHEHAGPTAHPKVLCARDSVESWEVGMIDELIEASTRGADAMELRRLLHRIVPDAMWTPGEPVMAAAPLDGELAQTAPVDDDAPVKRRSRPSLEIPLIAPGTPRPLPAKPAVPS